MRLHFMWPFMYLALSQDNAFCGEHIFLCQKVVQLNFERFSCCAPVDMDMFDERIKKNAFLTTFSTR